MNIKGKTTKNLLNDNYKLPQRHQKNTKSDKNKIKK